ncbi:MAG: tetratricopeptide repeat protein [Candidatus Endonucleobacter sp. (ex Gigantidas childressi)]|nr:tetratricopeptide repeat protein [Candidatus Endonucleobacter sp. (ex Gigantidas childressi)]
MRKLITLLLILLVHGIAYAGQTLTETVTKGISYFNEKKYFKAFECFKEPAKKENAEAQYYLGHMLYQGLGVAASHHAAFKWLRQSAVHGNIKAQTELADMFYHGHGISDNRIESAAWRMVANKNGRIWILKHYDDDIITEHDNLKIKDRAYEIWQIVSESNDCKQTLEEGMSFLSNGEGEFAVKIFKTAAAQGSAIAEYNLGCMYYEGNGVHKDYRTAFHWFYLSAYHDYSDAQSEIANMYFNGCGVEKDIIESCAWFDIANTKEVKYRLVASSDEIKALNEAELNRIDKRNGEIREWIAHNKTTPLTDDSESANVLYEPPTQESCRASI